MWDRRPLAKRGRLFVVKNQCSRALTQFIAKRVQRFLIGGAAYAAMTSPSS
jgi:hypothetical protein